jgi:hypothetical protein
VVPCTLDEVDDEKDLDGLMQSDLKWNRQCTKAAKTANRAQLFKYRYGIAFI